MNRRAFLKAAGVLGGVTAGEGAFPRILQAASAGPGNDEVLAQARERIEQHRKGAGRVRVVDSAGKPVARAQVKFEQLEHEFLFGCNFFMFDRLKERELEQAYRDRFAAVFNYATLGFYWSYYEPQEGHPIYPYTDKVTEWCGQHRVRCKGHPLVWDFADPQWLPREFEQIRALSNARVRDIVARYRGRLDMWDVVNEPTHLGRFKTRLGEWAQSMGAVPYVIEHLKLARDANPQATLLVNDYRTDPPFYRILDALRDGDKLLFDAIGIQSHMHDGGWPLAKVWDVCDMYAPLGRPIHFTETTIVSGPRKGPGENWGGTEPAMEASQAEYVPQFYTALFAHPSVQAITWWDFSDNGAWQRAAAGWVRKDMSPKPVYERMLRLIRKEWWTGLEGETDGQGELQVNAFYGRHRVSVESARGRIQQDVDWSRASNRQPTLRIG